jgi:malate/lactate dehydrogenase
MILNVHERLLVLGVLPNENNFATLKILDELRMNLSYTEKELEKWEIVVDNESNMVKWEENGEADIPIGEKATGIIVDQLRKLDKQDKLTLSLMSVYEKFIPTA